MKGVSVWLSGGRNWSEEAHLNCAFVTQRVWLRDMIYTASQS